MPFDRAHDAKVRAAAFEWLSEQVKRHSDVLPRAVLAEGFYYHGARVPLLGPQGIFKPQVLSEVPLSITTAPEGPYDDAFGADGLLRYRYRGQNREHSDNRGLRAAMERRLPLVYFHGLAKGRYLATWPVFIVQDDPPNLVFSVAVDDAVHVPVAEEVREGDDVRRAYITASVRVRLWVKERPSRTLYVITGSVFDRDGDAQRDPDADAKRMTSSNGKTRVAVPSHLYKILVDRGTSESLTILLPHDQTDLDGDAALKYLGDHVKRISDIEAVTGTSFGITASEATALWPFIGTPAGSLVFAPCRETAGHHF